MQMHALVLQPYHSIFACIIARLLLWMSHIQLLSSPFWGCDSPCDSQGNYELVPSLLASLGCIVNRTCLQTWDQACQQDSDLWSTDKGALVLITGLLVIGFLTGFFTAGRRITNVVTAGVTVTAFRLPSVWIGLVVFVSEFVSIC